MLNVEFTINGTVNYLSMEGHALTHNWRPMVISFDAPTLMIPSYHGGYAKMIFGKITFNPSIFSSDWPPPINGAISIYYTDTDEAGRELVFSGTAHLSNYDREQVTYALHGSAYDETIAAATVYNNTLNNVITTILTTIPEITTVDTTYARAISPNVTHTTSAVQLAINLASNIAEFYSHLIYIVGSTAYLVDMLLDNGADWTLTEFKYFSMPSYEYNNPVSEVTSSYGGTTYKASSAYPYGSALSVNSCHTTQANIEAALANILTIENSPRISFAVPMMAGNFPRLGQKIIIPDTAHVASLSSWIRARKLTFDFLNSQINIEGEGAIAA
ncbi:MAG: hypothetical protein ACYDHW_10725 [Syntrophorhabdaceae bacterium]